MQKNEQGAKRRSYDGTARRAQSAQTRQRIVDTARRSSSPGQPTFNP